MGVGDYPWVPQKVKIPITHRVAIITQIFVL
ncbi:hypothetical protein Mic7113_6192 [Allocoleopsis franciscana PCC 7113]|uniref:Uncharacterized protein n=1 Tax=Allocoleopsis franciscana PCC 7113 TaxID=1173027 RepID=K9WPR9_9CYAN|nr:hypothetical protein Mic7113_6192 [Allocoleopsis franciscana PCC 7113]